MQRPNTPDASDDSHGERAAQQEPRVTQGKAGTSPRRAAAVGAAAFVLAGSAAVATPATAAADTVQADCGETVTAEPGDQVQTPFGLKTIADGVTSLVGGLLGGVCNVTVNVVDATVAQVPAVGPPAADVTGGAVRDSTNAVSGTAKQLGDAVAGSSNQPAPQQPPSGGAGQRPAPQQPGPGTGAPVEEGPISPAPITLPEPNSPVLDDARAPTAASLPTDFSTGYAPMRYYSAVPAATSGLFAPSPGIRYGGQVPGYAPEFGILNQERNAPPPAPVPNEGVQRAGEAEALPHSPNPATDGIGLPTLVAVLALSGVTAALVRTWVLRRAT